MCTMPEKGSELEFILVKLTALLTRKQLQNAKIVNGYSIGLSYRYTHLGERLSDETQPVPSRPAGEESAGGRD